MPPPGPSVDQSSRPERLLAWAMGLVLALGTAWAVSGPFRAHAPWMLFEQDDFFYYLKIAGNFASGHGSTFNGIVPTNGYHPLWMLLLAAVLRLGAGPHGVFVYLGVTVWLATMAVWACGAILLGRSGLGALASSTLAAFVAVYCMHLFVEGMEVTLAVPLMFALLAAVQPVAWWAQQGTPGVVRSALIGLLASAMILARLDTALFAALLGVGILLQPSLRKQLGRAQLLGVAFGLLPVVGYLLVNRIAFGLWMPVSGMAKELKLDHNLSLKPWAAVVTLSHTQQFNIFAVLAVLLLLPWIWSRLPPIERVLATAALSFPFLYFAVLSYISDWRLWGWYFYSLRPAVCLVLLVIFRLALPRRLLAWPPILVLIVLVTLLRIHGMLWDQQSLGMVDAAEDLRAFAATHPGIYAMGDRAGSPGYLVSQPIIQTEGLVMNRDFLTFIRQQAPLRDVLAHYGVHYYIGTAMLPFTGCFQALEPSQAGPHAPHMRATFCDPPVAQWTHDDVHTMVFDVSGK